MKILAVIPARYASTRLPAKPLADIEGKPMIQWVYEAVKACASVSRVIVATDDLRILDAVLGFGGMAEMTSESHMNGTARCAEVAGRHTDHDYIINVQGDEPLINPEHLEKLIGLLASDTQIATLYRKLEDEESIIDPAQVKVVKDNSDRALYFSRSAIPFNRDSGPVDYYGHIGLYAFKRDILEQLILLPASSLELAENLEQLRWLEHGYRIQLAEIDEPAPSVDTPEGLEKVRALMRVRLNKA
ncbi:MAG TPA: 3-deoxy-manno-octulosonate cytidylyltransferase [Bacteroidetes bacterium]|nr:3-deoxy-manno-octulosonate cytidylyltransferase [Bacteroidota bacterium]